MRTPTKEYKYPLRLPVKAARAVQKVSRQSGASFNTVVALCIRKALPQVGEALGVGETRITMVDPLPEKVARKLYAEPDDDTDSIRAFMNAQVTSIEE